jgi:hypothetical protein
MRKWLVILAVAAAVAVGVSGQPDKAANNKQQEADHAPPLVDTQKGAADHQAQADPDSGKWYAPLKRPEWWLVGAAFLTLYAVWRQVRESAKATRAMQDSIALQEKALEQWIEPVNWRSELQPAIEGVNFLRVQLEIINPTDFPVTIKVGKLQMKNSDGIEYDAPVLSDAYLTPKVSYDLEFWIELSKKQVDLFATEVVSIKVLGYMTHVGVLRKSITQVIAGILACSQTWTNFQPEIHMGPRPAIKANGNKAHEHPKAN